MKNPNYEYLGTSPNGKASKSDKKPQKPHNLQGGDVTNVGDGASMEKHHSH